MHFETAECSMKGGRKINEDSVGYINQGSLVNAWVLADGLGGHGSGEVASKLAVDTVLLAYSQNPIIDTDNIRDIILAANNTIISNQTDKFSMKSTIVSMFSDGDNVIWAHAGDSRLYRFTDGVLSFQTRDHSVSQIAVANSEITSEKIRFHEDRNKLLRVLGSDNNIKTEIHVPEQKLKPGDAFLLCSDGFWEYVLELEMELDLSKAETPSDWISLLTARLSKKVDGKNDNYSAIAIFVKK